MGAIHRKRSSAPDFILKPRGEPAMAGLILREILRTPLRQRKRAVLRLSPIPF
jgi:hypothetical protein